MINETDPSTILIVDDEPDNLRLTIEMLRDHGLDLVTARDGADGLRIASRLRPDLVLLDIRMPGLDGFEICARLKRGEDTRDIPVIFLTAADEIDDKIRGFAVGGVDYVTKPFDSRELLCRVCNHLRLARRVEATVEPSRDADPLDTTQMRQSVRSLDVLLHARDILLADLAHSPDLDALARRCGTNRTSLQRLFHSHIGMSVFGYLREQRLQHARNLLDRGDCSVDMVAVAVGYSSGRELSRAFKKRFGVSPGLLRKSDQSAPLEQASGFF